MSLPEATRSAIKSTIPLLRTRGTEVVRAFYEDLFTRYPGVKRQFNHDRITSDGTPAQVAALTKAVLLYASRIDDLAPVIPLLRPIAEKHVSRGVSAEQYDVVGDCLLAAMKQVLGPSATDDVLRAWAEAYVLLKDVFVGMEKQIRDVNEKRAGWSGMKKVVVKGIRPVHGGRVITFDVGVKECSPGMFVSVGVEVDGEETMTSVDIVQVHDTALSVMVGEDMEIATRALMKLVQGDSVRISIPCGKP